MELTGWLLLAAVLVLATAAAYLLGRRKPRGESLNDTLFELSPDPSILVDTDGIICQANHASCKLLGYNEGQLNGQPVDILVPEGIRAQHRHLISLFFSTTGERRMANRIWVHDAQGRKINAEIHLSLVQISGKPMALATIRDTSALWKEERKLREQRKAYDELFELSSVGICTVSLGGRFLRVNRHLCEFLGYSREELIELCFQDITHPDDLDADVSNVNDLLKGVGSSYSMEKRYKTSDGRFLWANLTVTLIRDEQDFPDYFISVIQDIGDRKQSESLLQQSEVKFRTIAETIQSVVWMSSPGIERILFINPAYESIWGRSCDSLYERPQSFIEGIHPEDRQKVIQEIEQHKSGSWEVRYRVVHPRRGVRYVYDTGKGVRNGKGQLEYVIGLATDITDSVEAQMELERSLKKEKEATERLNQLVRTDALTGCLNRQALYEELEGQLALYRRYKTPSSILFIDLNDFKEINDTYGHIAGDDALRALAEHIRSHIRSTDILARYAGDEFVVILPQSNVREASMAMRNLRANVLSHSTQAGDFPVHFSIGLAYVGYPDVKDSSSWIEVADQAMYLDKAANSHGRKRKLRKTADASLTAEAGQSEPASQASADTAGPAPSQAEPGSEPAQRSE
ncbi:PAS domain S-box protein [Thalassolituus sp. LLYu03]|uniref:PAS domain S-box protein n=1 Tax=Thalassolituus sp. LLYu03 TaxID=3421656 RepID=UPI003D27DC54